uniref:SJCHGC06983 protein n=1 Tax=Schistosoma japonicum TaxID=6182 RepID=Q5DF84_SCHJA|nr:SJCHGC06983 protein [Schistosoma japonicum]
MGKGLLRFFDPGRIQKRIKLLISFGYTYKTWKLLTIQGLFGEVFHFSILFQYLSYIKQNPSSIVYAHLTKWPKQQCNTVSLNRTTTFHSNEQLIINCKRELHLPSISGKPNFSEFALLDGSLTGMRLSFKPMNQTTMTGVIISLPELIMNSDKQPLQYAWTIRMTNVF